MSIKSRQERREALAEWAEIRKSMRFQKAERIKHHKETNVATHSEETAMYGRRICGWLKKHNVDVNEEDVVQACLLHDIGMTDEDVSGSSSWKKAYKHPERGEEIARKEYHANEVQCDAIKRHMWPICIIPPKSLEGWVVIAADKACSIHEVAGMTEDILGIGHKEED